MDFLIAGLIIIGSYLIGSIPFGLLLVKLKTGQDIRTLHSGRTGGTNAMRAGGVWIGLATGILDGVKGAVGVWLASAFLPGSSLLPWVQSIAPLFGILGHNYSAFLIAKGADGKIRFHGGAGGGPTAGASIALWWPSVFFIIPVGFFFLYFIGYASVATISFAATSIVIFTILALGYGFPWQYILFAVLALGLLLWSLRPNLKRLANGTERVVGYRARKNKQRAAD